MNNNEIVLVVDDSPDALSLINDALETEGLDVLVALEGKQALTIAQRIKPDVILLDAVMPVMDGFETCRQLKANAELADIPVIFMTGLSDTDDIVRGLDVGGVDYLVKPIKPAELLARMRVHLNNARLARSAQSALDSTGHHLFTAASDGQIKWATPQTYALFAKANVDQGEMTTRLHTWLSQGPEEGDSIALDNPGNPLVVQYAGKPDQGNGDWLLKLLDGNRPQNEALLRSKLDLTERESEVLFWIANGKTNREAAEILEMSPRTVNKHLEMIFPKLGVENRTAAAGVALRVLANA